MEKWMIVLSVAICVVCSGAVSAFAQRGEAGTEKRFLPSRELLRYMLLQYPGGHERSLSGIPFRPVRRLGSEFLGKRSGPASKRSMLGSEFLGKRSQDFLLAVGRDPLDFYPKRNGMIGSEFLGKRASNPQDARSKESPQNLIVGAYGDTETD